jgi:hypothetical protein
MQQGSLVYSRSIEMDIVSNGGYMETSGVLDNLIYTVSSLGMVLYQTNYNGG